jgi:hypothetical protein
MFAVGLSPCQSECERAKANFAADREIDETASLSSVQLTNKHANVYS